MAKRENRKRRFFADHPLCCFCGGVAPAATIDHVPSRVCFIGRAAPHGYEFPACEACQSATRIDEMVFAMFVRLHDLNTQNYSTNEMQKLIAGIKNNLPQVVPAVVDSLESKLKGLASHGLKPSTRFSADMVPMIAIPVEAEPYIDRYCRKLAKALYYREKGKILPNDHMLWTQWNAPTDQHVREALHELVEMTPIVRQGSRPNLPFGDRFGYRLNNENPDLFAALAQFGRGLLISMFAAPAINGHEKRLEDWLRAEDWLSHDDRSGST